MKKKYLALALMALTGVAFADPTPPNECGNHGNNCEGGSGGSSTSDANAEASASAVALAGAISGSSSSVGDIKNTNSNLNVSTGGEGGRGGDGGAGYGGTGLGFGGEAAQDQDQDQDQHQSATSQASNSGVSNSTVIKTERNAPPVSLGNIYATVSCAGGFNVGGSDRNGAGALGFTWISSDCKSVVAGQNMQVLGMVDVACKIFKTTDGFKRAAARDPSLKDVDCTKAER